jgi:hypothetical protein
MTLPNLFIIGAPRSGTTSIHEFLASHRDVFMSPVKEPQFFSSPGWKLNLNGPNDRVALGHLVSDSETYSALFANAGADHRVVGEASTTYIYFPGTAEAIRQTVPAAKIVAILREPVARAHSDFLRQRRNGDEPIADFAEAIHQEPRRIEAGWAYRWHYRARSLYHARLQEYFESFPRDSLRVFLFEELVSDRERFLAELCEFLGIERAAGPNLDHVNRGGEPRSSRIQRAAAGESVVGKVARRLVPKSARPLARKLVGKANLSVPEIDSQLAAELRAGFRPDIERVQELIERDLTHWLSS